MSSPPRRPAYAIGCLALTLGSAAFLAYHFGRVAVVILTVIGAVPLANAVVRGGIEQYQVRRFRRQHPGKDLFLVYSESDAWHDRIENQWLPLWRDRTVTFNRSHPWDHSQLEAKVWSAFASDKGHTPLAVYIPPVGDTRAFYLFEEFREAERGQPERLLSSERELSQLMGTPPPAT